MRKLVKQRTESKTIAQQDKFVFELCALFPRPSQILDRGEPFSMCWFRFTCKSMEMVNEGRAELERPRVRT
jgi:hypothetical protein